MTPPRPSADVVAVLEGAKEDFFKRHAKDRKRANDAWQALVAKAPVLTIDTQVGLRIPRERWPDGFEGHANLFLIPELPHRFRAVYTVFRDPVDGIVVRVEWVGDHREYDKKFGYGTS